MTSKCPRWIIQRSARSPQPVANVSLSWFLRICSLSFLSLLSNLYPCTPSPVSYPLFSRAGWKRTGSCHNIPLSSSYLSFFHPSVQVQRTFFLLGVFIFGNHAFLPKSRSNFSTSLSYFVIDKTPHRDAILTAPYSWPVGSSYDRQSILILST